MLTKKENGHINYIIRPSLIKKVLKEPERQYTVNKIYLQEKANHYIWHGHDPLLKIWQSFSLALMSFSLLWYECESWKWECERDLYLVREEHTLFHQGLFSGVFLPMSGFACSQLRAGEKLPLFEYSREGREVDSYQKTGLVVTSLKAKIRYKIKNFCCTISSSRFQKIMLIRTCLIR